MSSLLGGGAWAQANPHVVRLAKLQIDSSKLSAYKAELKLEIETSIREEPGVLSLQAVATKDKPNAFTLLEVYADAQAYRSHLNSPHFKKYKTATLEMIESLELFECEPLILATKSSPSEKL